MNHPSCIAAKPNRREATAPIRTLVADDSLLVRESLHRLIARISEIEVVATANNGAEAVELARISAPDLVLMDFHMPEMDGLNASAIIRREHPDIRIIIMTAHDLEVLKSSGFSQAVDEFISKQYLPYELAGVVGRLFNMERLLDSAGKDPEPPPSDNIP